VFAQRVAAVEEPEASDLYETGTIARVVASAKQPDGTWALVVHGLARVRLAAVVESAPYLRAKVEPLTVSGDEGDDELTALGLSLREATGAWLETRGGVPAAAVERL